MSIEIEIVNQDRNQLKKAYAIDNKGRTICWNVFPQKTTDKEIRKVVSHQAKLWLKDKKE